MKAPIHAVPAESNAGHQADRRCPCGPIAMRDLNTGQVSIWRHRPPPPEVRSLRPRLVHGPEEAA